VRVDPHGLYNGRINIPTALSLSMNKEIIKKRKPKRKKVPNGIKTL